jgi:hypothetical protein
MRGVTGLGHATASGFAQPVRRAVREPGIVGPFPKLLAEIVPAICCSPGVASRIAASSGRIGIISGLPVFFCVTAIVSPLSVCRMCCRPMRTETGHRRRSSFPRVYLSSGNPKGRQRGLTAARLKVRAGPNF